MTDPLSFRATVRWTPSRFSLRRGRAVQVKVFNKPENLPVPLFARYARKSTLQVLRDIRHRRLLALSLGSRGMRIPAWQLQPSARKLTQGVLQGAKKGDELTIYFVLAAREEAVGGRVAVDTVRFGNLARVQETVLWRLGFH